MRPPVTVSYCAGWSRDSGICNLEYVVSAADSHSLANAGRDGTTHEEIDAIADLAHSAGGGLEVIIATAWDCPFDGRTDPSRVLQIVDNAVAHDVDQLCIADTIGTVTPTRVLDLLGLSGAFRYRSHRQA